MISDNPRPVVHTLPFRRKLLSQAILGLTLGFGSVSPAVMASDATSQNQTLSFNIPAGSLDQALSTFGQQSGLLVSVDSSLTTNQTTNGLKGRYTVEQALQQLLKDSDIQFRLKSGNSVILKAASGQNDSTQPSSSGTGTQLDQLEIIAFNRDYKRGGTSTALGFNADPNTVPLSSMSVPTDVLEDQQVNNVEDALRNVSGVTRFKQGNGGEERFSIRGFDASQSLYKDGARLNNSLNATNIATTETANIDRYDVLKGPAAIIYGQGEPGGIINYITKKPEFDQKTTIELIAGSDQYSRVELDTTGPLGSEDSNLAYRFVASYQDSEANRDYIARERLLLAPSLKWQISHDSALTLQYENISDDYTQDRGQVLDGDPVTGFNYSGRLNDSQFFGIPGWNERTHSDYQRFGVLFDHEFSEGTEFKLNLSSTRVDKTLYDSNPFPPLMSGLPGISPNNAFVVTPAGGYVPTSFLGLPADMAEGDVLISARGTDGKGETDAINLSQSYLWHSSDDMSHQFLVRGSYEQLKSDYDKLKASIFGVIYNIDTGTYTGLPDGEIEITGRSPVDPKEVNQTVVSVQDLISVGEQLNILVGGSFTSFENEAENQTTEEFTPRLGIIYQLQDNLAVYGSWATGFSPTTYKDINDNPVKPETSEQFEAGIKLDLLDDKLQLNAAIFDVYKKDVVVADINSSDPFFDPSYLNVGETHSRGAELQITGDVSDSLRVIGGYTYMDNEFTDSGGKATIADGTRMPGVPEHAFNLWGVYEFHQGILQGLGLGAGVFAQSDVYVSTENKAKYDGWTQLDLMAYYKKDNWKLQLNIKNVTDEQYNLAQHGITEDPFGAVRVGTSTPLSTMLSLSYQL